MRLAISGCLLDWCLKVVTLNLRYISNDKTEFYEIIVSVILFAVVIKDFKRYLST